MCTDFTGLNKACPKDFYPLPSLGRLVDGSAGNEVFDFMDASRGYHQIRMLPENEEKPHSSLNMVIGRNMEIYVDDMLVKSKTKADHLKNLRETFNRLRESQLKVNPEKCSFRVISGKFLEYMITERGIEPNPDKIQALLMMEPPKSYKELCLAISDVAVSSVLVREVEGTQRLIYYVSHVFREAEERYLVIDKASFAVVVSARKLKAYFE
ncbi:hypothetical protein LIER_11291 [Lithospermum erythrorhizon]|uniref:Reverse transcriptase domain-containing protein n=1 Tax=Lithospermum erythrorhizon TaxID=34254 RepID=A0AAV3PNR3_LITER